MKKSTKRKSHENNSDKGKECLPVYLNSKDLNRISSYNGANGEKKRGPLTNGIKSNNEKYKIAQERKEKMQAMDYERKQKEEESANSLETSHEADDCKGKAKDLAKLLNTISQRAVAFHIRDQQMKDKKQRLEKERDYERRMNIAMEIDRLRDIENREKEEARKLEKRVADRKIIEEQMEERRKQKLLQEEEREQENQRMLAKIKEYEKQCANDETRKKEISLRARKEILDANKAALDQRMEAKEREKAEVEEILAYQALQDEKLRLREEAEAEVTRQKLEIQKKMLEAQTKSQDKQSELDELRHRRAWEEAERRTRQKELADARKRRDDMIEMNEFRRRQEAEKEAQQKLDEKARQEEYENALKHALDMAEREKKEALLRERKNAQFREDIQKQIEQNELKKKQLRLETVMEGKKMKEEMLVERKSLENIRNRIVDDMASSGVNSKYFSEMLAIDLEKFHMR